MKLLLLLLPIIIASGAALELFCIGKVVDSSNGFVAFGWLIGATIAIISSGGLGALCLIKVFSL